MVKSKGMLYNFGTGLAVFRGKGGMLMNINEFYNTLDTFFAEKKISEAEKFLLDCLAKAEAERDFALVIAASNELGGIYRVLSRYQEGAALYEKALDALRKTCDAEGENYATTLINYGTILSMAGKFQEALERYNDAVKTLQMQGIEGDYRMAALYNNMSGLYQKKGDLNAAATYMHKALLIIKNLRDSEAEVAISYSNLAGIYIRLGNLEDAEKYARQAVRDFRQMSGDRDVHYSAAVCTLGEVHFAKGEYEKAEELFSDALGLIARDYGKDNDSYRVVERNLKKCRECQEKIGGK